MPMSSQAAPIVTHAVPPRDRISELRTFGSPGAMIYVVVEELIPESQQAIDTHRATLGAMLGFVMMMILDVALG